MDPDSIECLSENAREYILAHEPIVNLLKGLKISEGISPFGLSGNLLGSVPFFDSAKEMLEKLKGSDYGDIGT